jgi:hypothetical protein
MCHDEKNDDRAPICVDQAAEGTAVEVEEASHRKRNKASLQDTVSVLETIRSRISTDSAMPCGDSVRGRESGAGCGEDAKPARVNGSPSRRNTEPRGVCSERPEAMRLSRAASEPH